MELTHDPQWLTTLKSLEPNSIIITADNLEKSKASIVEILYRVLAQSLRLTMHCSIVLG